MSSWSIIANSGRLNRISMPRGREETTHAYSHLTDKPSTDMEVRGWMEGVHWTSRGLVKAAQWISKREARTSEAQQWIRNYQWTHTDCQ